MADKGFQEPRTGNLFFPAYIYTYPPEQEYEIRKQLHSLNQKLKRPNNYLDCLVINVFQELTDFLKESSFAGNSLFDLILDREKEDAQEAYNWICDEINRDEGFYSHIEKKVQKHFREDSPKRVYLILYGFGSIYPYLRASEFLKRTERLIKDFKLILFYPGKYANSRYHLFGLLDDDHMYRANHLNVLFE